MRKTAAAVMALTILMTASGFTSEEFSLADLSNYQREYKSESIGACSASSTKTYEDYSLITSTGSAQYKYIHEKMTVDETTGLLIDEDGFIGVAMGWQFGEIGSRYYVVLDTGIVIPVVKVDSKSASHVPNGCSVEGGGSMLEFVIDDELAYDYFGGTNGLVSNGNFNNYEYFKGKITDVEAVLDEKLEEGVTYDTVVTETTKDTEQSASKTILKGGY